jgi:hypothetical protein
MVISMRVNVTLVFEREGIEGVVDMIEHLKLPDEAEIDIDGEVMTVGELRREYHEYQLEYAKENDIDRIW